MIGRALDRGSVNRTPTRDQLHSEGRHLVRFAVREDEIDLRRADDIREVRGVEVGRTQHEAPDYAVDFDQCQCRRELIRCPDQNRSTPQCANWYAEGGPGGEIRERDGAIRSP